MGYENITIKITARIREKLISETANHFANTFNSGFLTRIPLPPEIVVGLRYWSALASK
jgi:hypothetical protein